MLLLRHLLCLALLGAGWGGVRWGAVLVSLCHGWDCAVGIGIPVIENLTGRLERWGSPYPGGVCWVGGVFFLFVSTGAGGGERGGGRERESFRTGFFSKAGNSGRLSRVLDYSTIVLWVLSCLPRSHDNVLSSHRQRSRITPCSNISVSHSGHDRNPSRKEEKKKGRNNPPKCTKNKCLDSPQPMCLR